MELLIQAVSQLGLPIALAVWLLVKDAKQAEKAQAQWEKIKEAIDRQTNTLNDISYFIKYHELEPKGIGGMKNDEGNQGV